MDARVVLLHLWTVVVLLIAELKWIEAAEVYTNTWAVQINGGPEEADRIARQHGFVNHGNVSPTCSMCACVNEFVHMEEASLIVNYITACETVSKHSYGS